MSKPQVTAGSRKIAEQLCVAYGKTCILKVEHYGGNLFEVYYPKEWLKEPYPHPSLTRLFEKLDTIGYQVVASPEPCRYVIKKK